FTIGIYLKNVVIIIFCKTLTYDPFGSGRHSHQYFYQYLTSLRLVKREGDSARTSHDDNILP
ncbi:MAG: hypothetical protein KBF75_11095, partial [Saprospiraceae bacterium]|nr:hypothetical protein [Saprospiraceae bacterium]